MLQANLLQRLSLVCVSIVRSRGWLIRCTSLLTEDAADAARRGWASRPKSASVNDARPPGADRGFVGVSREIRAAGR